MIKLGLVSAATYGPSYRGADVPRTPGSFHGTAFASTYNGYDPAKAQQWEWTFAAAGKRIEGVQVVKVWDPDHTWAKGLADACFIPEVCQTPEACCDGVDGVVIVDDGSARQCDDAVHPLKQGIPTFCDTSDPNLW